MRNISDKICRRNQKKHILWSLTVFFFRKSCWLWNNVKNIVERGRPQITIWRMRIACWIPKATNTHLCYVILIVFSTVTMDAQSRPNVTLYVHCLSCFRSTTLLDFIHRPVFFAVNNTKFNFKPMAATFCLPANSTRCSQAVTHLNTDHAQCCLTALIYRKQMQSAWHGRWPPREIECTEPCAMFSFRCCFQQKFLRISSSLSCEPHVQTNWSF